MKWKKIFETPNSWEININKKRAILLAFALLIIVILVLPSFSDILSARQEYIAGQRETDVHEPLTPPPSPTDENAPYLTFEIPKEKVKMFIVDPHYDPLSGVPDASGGIDLGRRSIDYYTGGIFTCILDIPIEKLQLRIPKPFVTEAENVQQEAPIGTWYDKPLPEGVTISDEAQWYDLLSDWVNFDVTIEGLNEAYAKVMTGKVIGKKIRSQYDKNRPQGTLTSWQMDGMSNSLEIVFQGELTDIRHFEICVVGTVKREMLPKEITDALGDPYLKGFGAEIQTITPCVQKEYLERDQAELLDLTIEVTCWTDEMHTSFDPSVYQTTPYVFDPDNPEIGKAIYSIEIEGKEVKVMRWGALQISVDYNFPEEFKEILDFYISVRFPDPYQPQLIANVQSGGDVKMETDEILTIYLEEEADLIDSNSPDALVWYWDDQKEEYVGRKRKEGEKALIYVPLINGKYLVRGIDYEVIFTTFYRETESSEDVGTIVENATFTIIVKEGQSYRTSVQRKDKCGHWVNKWLPEKLKALGYTLCTIEQMIHRASIAVKTISSYILGGSPSATIEMARLYKGSLGTAVLLGAIVYIMFILALLLLAVGIISMNLDMAWFGARIWIFLTIFSYLQITIGHKFKTPYGMFSLIGDFFKAIFKIVGVFWKDITTGNPYMWGVVAIAILIIYILSGRRS